MQKLLLGFLLAVLIALAAYRSRSLSRSGAWGALATGTIIFGLGGWQWAVVLMAFFISSSLLTRLFGKQKTSLNEKFEKGGQRDLGQVLANGGVASFFALLNAAFPASSWTWAGFAASLAAVNADTWATELGVLSPSLPRLVTNGKVVEKGTSGAISLFGTLAALGGSAFIALMAVIISPVALSDSRIAFGLICLTGLLGALFDSFLGATVQAIYRCPKCNKETERHPLHTCGTKTVQVRGWRWLNNDLVNLACGLSAALLILLAWR